MKKRDYIEILVNAGVDKEVAEKALLAIPKVKRKALPKKGDVLNLILVFNGGYDYWLDECKSIPRDATYDLTESPAAEKPRTPTPPDSLDAANKRADAELAAYALTVENLTTERDALANATNNDMSVVLLERIAKTLNRLGFVTPEGGIECFNARIETQL